MSSINFYAVRKDKLFACPHGVRKFILKFFEEKVIFDQVCFVALSGEYKEPWLDVEDPEYEVGLTEREKNDCGVWTYFDNHPEIVFQYRWS